MAQVRLEALLPAELCRALRAASVFGQTFCNNKAFVRHNAVRPWLQLCIHRVETARLVPHLACDLEPPGLEPF